METTRKEDYIPTEPDVEEKTAGQLLPEHERPAEPDAGGTVVKAAMQNHEGVPGSGTEINPHLNESMETSLVKSEGHQDRHSEIVEIDTVSDEVVPNMVPVQLNPELSEEMETSMAEVKGDLNPQDFVINKAADLAELVPKNETTDTRVTEVEDSVSPTVKKDLSPLLGGGGSLALLSMQYRDEDSDDLSDSDSDASSTTSSSSSSSSSGPTVLVMDEDEDETRTVPGTKSLPVKTQEELLLEDLPAVENLTISLPEETSIEAVGKISSIIDQLVIVESNKDTPPLNEDSVLFTKDRISIGKVFEIFGPVFQPYYILRFNSHEDIEQKNLRIAEPVFFAPMIKDFTEYIFVEQLKQAKGSDASWKNDNEPPPEALDFSDDDEERLAKKKIKTQRTQPQNQEESNSANESSACRPSPSKKPSRRKPHQEWNSQRGRPEYHNFQSGFHANYHANPHFQQDYMLPPPCPFPPPFHDQGYPPYPPMPPPHMGRDHWNPSPYRGAMFYNPPPPPPPSSN